MASIRSNRGDAADERRILAAGNAAVRTNKPQAVLDGFELSVSAGDVVVAIGRIDRVPVATQTLDVSVLALGDGENQIVIEDGTVTAIAGATALSGKQVKLGEFTELTGAATAVSLTGKGSVAPANW
jgi:hypothetical protein